MGFFTLPDILAQLRQRHPALNQRLREANAVARWEKAVGETIAKHATVAFVRDSVLFIRVEHPIWRSELHHRKRQILEILNRDPDQNSKEEKAAVIEDLFFIGSEAEFKRQQARAKYLKEQSLSKQKKPEPESE